MKLRRNRGRNMRGVMIPCGMKGMWIQYILKVFKIQKKCQVKAHSDLGDCIRCLPPRMSSYIIIIIVISSIILLSPVAEVITYRKMPDEEHK